MTTSNRWVLAATIMFASAAWGLAAPALGEKQTKWEYAELTFVRNPGGKAAGNPGGAPVPGQKIKIVFTKLDGEIETASWEELADKLKAPALKEESTPKLQKFRALNQLGADGWEMVQQTGSEDTIGGFGAKWIFKRRAP